MIDHVVTASNASSTDIQRLLGYPSDRVTVVYPGVDSQQFRPAESAIAGDVPYVFAVAAADPTKNIETLIQAFARLPVLYKKGAQTGYCR